MPDGVFVIVPAYDERDAIGDVVRALRRLPVRVVVVDDGSNDGTDDAARAAGASVVRHPLNRGQGAAIQTGFDVCLAAAAEVLVTFDADGQHSVDDIPRLVAPIAEGRLDVVLGSRFLGTTEGITALRKTTLKMGVVFTRLFSGARLTDAHNGIRAFSAAAAGRIRLTQDRMAHASQIIDQIVGAELRFEEVPVSVRYTDYSRAKGQRSRRAVRIAFDYLLGRFAK